MVPIPISAPPPKTPAAMAVVPPPTPKANTQMIMRINMVDPPFIFYQPASTLIRQRELPVSSIVLGYVVKIAQTEGKQRFKGILAWPQRRRS